MGGDGLWRWLLGGLVAGLIVLGLLVGAYAIGYHRGREKARSATPQPAPPAQPTTTANTPTGGGLAVRGGQLFAADGCSSCHSLSGGAGVGPTIKGLAGSSVQLADGRTVTADDAYLAKSISDPDAEIVKAYKAGVMSAAISTFDLRSKPRDVNALVAFLKTRR